MVDDWHGRGVATALIRKLSDRALANGIRGYRAYVSSDNEVVLDALQRAGARHDGEEAGELEFVVDVPRDGLGVRLRGALSAAGSGQLRIARRMAARRRERARVTAMAARQASATAARMRQVRDDRRVSVLVGLRALPGKANDRSTQSLAVAGGVEVEGVGPRPHG